MVLTVKELMHSDGNGGSQKTKRGELSDSEDEHEGDDAFTDSTDMDEAYEKLVTVDEKKKKTPGQSQKVSAISLPNCLRFMTQKEL